MNLVAGFGDVRALPSTLSLQHQQNSADLITFLCRCYNFWMDFQEVCCFALIVLMQCNSSCRASTALHCTPIGSSSGSAEAPALLLPSAELVMTLVFCLYA
jgi:hypothetical protein